MDAYHGERKESYDHFYLQGVSVDLVPAPAGQATESLVVLEGLPGVPVTVDRFDCRLLLDPSDVHHIVSSEFSEQGGLEDSDEELDKVRYGDLHQEEFQEPREQAVYSAVPFSYGSQAESTVYIAPPPPLAPAILKQMCEGDRIPCAGPFSLRELAAMQLVATRIQKPAMETENWVNKICHGCTRIPGMEFLRPEHVHHCVFEDLLSIIQQRNENVSMAVSSLDALKQYGDTMDTISSNIGKEEVRNECDMGIVTQVICGMFDKIRSKMTAEGIIKKIEHGQTWLNSSTCDEYENIVKLLRDQLERKLPNPVRGRPCTTTDIDGNPFEEADAIHVNQSTQASRLLRAQIMMKKRKIEHDEKSKVVREQTVREDTNMRQRQIAQIAQHRKMFEDSDDD